MDYETVLEEQLEATELQCLKTPLRMQRSKVVCWKNFPWRIWCTAAQDSRSWTLIQILENLKNLFLLEVRSSLMLGCEILAVCILIGMLTSFSDSFGKRTVSSWER